MALTTSAARRKPICTLGAATGGRPIFFHFLNCSGKTSLNGLARAKSSAVHSGISASSQSFCGICGGFSVFLLIASPFPVVGLPQRDGPHRVAAHGEGEKVKPPGNRPDGLKSGLSVGIPLIR